MRWTDKALSPLGAEPPPSWPRRRGRNRAERRESREIIRSMPLTDGRLDLETFVGNISTARGRQIHLVELPDRLVAATGICGLWVKHARSPVDLILHESARSSFHGLRIVLHELAHLWSDDAAGVTDGEFQALFDLPIELLERLVSAGKVAARRRYDSDQERRAEAVAALLQQRAYAPGPPTDTTARRLAEDLIYPSGAAPGCLWNADV